MKKIIRVLSAVIALTLAALCMMFTGFAAVDWNNVKPEPIIHIFSGIVLENDFSLDEGMYCMRGFAVSPDGKYAFCGFLNPKGCAALDMIDLDTAEAVDYYVHEQADALPSYPKGIAVDDRGYVYVGQAYLPNYGSVDYSILSYSDKGMEEIGFYNVVTSGKPGDEENSPKMGVNGVDIVKLDGKYYLYIVINYNMDRLYRFDVTDVTAPKLDTTFGNGGYVDLAATFNFSEGYYLDVDTDGTIYLGGILKTKEACLFEMSADGRELVRSAPCNGAYAVALADDYIIVTTQLGPTCLNIFDKVTFDLVATVAADSESYSYVYVTVIDDIIYIGNQGKNSADSESIVLAALSSDAEAAIEARKKSIADRAAEMSADTTAPIDRDTTVADNADTSAEPDDTTPVASDTTTATVTDTQKPAADTTAPAKDGGCGSTFVCGIAVTAILGCAIIVKKKN